MIYFSFILLPFLFCSLTHFFIYLLTHPLKNKLHLLGNISESQMPSLPSTEELIHCERQSKLLIKVHIHNHYHPHPVLRKDKLGSVCHAWVRLSMKQLFLLPLISEEN